jgi:hypothetical protein
LCELLVSYSEAYPPSDNLSALIEVGLEQAPDLLLLAFASLKVLY